MTVGDGPEVTAELAAAIVAAVLRSRAGTVEPAGSAPVNRWSAREAMLRGAVVPGPGAWCWSAR